MKNQECASPSKTYQNHDCQSTFLLVEKLTTRLNELKLENAKSRNTINVIEKRVTVLENS